MKLVYFPKVWHLKNGETYTKGFHAGWLSDDGEYALKFGIFVSEAEVKRALSEKHPDKEITFLPNPPRYREWDKVYHFTKEMIDKLTMSNKN